MTFKLLMEAIGFGTLAYWLAQIPFWIWEICEEEADVKIDLAEAMRQPTNAEIQESMRKYIIFQIHRDSVVRSILGCLKEQHAADGTNPEGFVAIKVGEKMMKELPPLFMSGKLLGMQVMMDVEEVGYGVTLLTKEDMDADARRAIGGKNTGSDTAGEGLAAADETGPVP